MTDTMLKTREDVLRELAEVGAELRAVNKLRKAYSARRLELFLAGRALDPPIQMSVMGEATGISQEAVVQTLLRRRLKQAALEERAEA